METEPANPEELPGKRFREQLAATVRNIQWSYAIFWSVSTRQQGVLAWIDGYYNGDIKTRKTTQPMEFKADQMGLHRSEQLRELYESLSVVDTNQQTKRPSASLSPEDLTDTEWYYLVCMSFTFLHGQGLPGRAFTNNQHIWLSNASFADSKKFSRSLLAKSASIRTVLCFPFMGGVLELGTTELVMEDPAFIQHVTTSFWEFQNPVFSELSISSFPIVEKDDEHAHPNLDDEIADTTEMENHNLLTDGLNPVESGSPAFPFALTSYASQNEAELNQDRIEDLHANICEELQVGSPDDSLNNYGPNQNTEDSPRMEELNGTSQVQSRQLMDDEFSNGLHGSLNSIDCISQSLMDHRRVLSSPKGERLKSNVLDYLQEGNYSKLISLDLDGDDSHYTRTLSAVVRNSKQLLSIPYSHNNCLDSSFTVWMRGFNASTPLTSTPQKLLKKILVDAEWIRGDRPSKPHEENGLRNKVYKLEGEDAGASHVLSERRRREKLNEKFLVLRSLVPSISKVDKASILGDTIEYLKELEKRVEELESCTVVELEARGRRKHLDIAERTSDNYGSNEAANGRKAFASKRKACDIEESEEEHHWVLTKDGPVDVNVTMTDKEVLFEMKCPWRDCLLLEIVEAINNLHMDPQSIQSSTIDNILVLVLRAKFRGSVVASPGMIKKTLQRVVGKC